MDTHVRPYHGMTMSDIIKVLLLLVLIAAMVAYVIYAPWILLWALKSMGVGIIVYNDTAWYGALVIILLFTGEGVIGRTLTYNLSKLSAKSDNSNP